MDKKAIIIGGGFSGCTMAYMLKQKGYDVVVYEATDRLGGGVRTEFYKGHPYTLGPHHLILKSDDLDALDYFNQFLDLRQIDHYVMTLPNGEDHFFNYPPIRSDIEKMKKSDTIKQELEARDISIKPKNLEEYWKNSVGSTLYSMFVETYSKKMWGIENNQELDQDISFSLKEEPVREELNEYFEGIKTIYYPREINGFNDYFDKTLQGCRVYMNTKIEKFDIPNKKIFVNDKWEKADVIVSTTSPDILFNYKYGELKYKGRDFLKIILPVEKITPHPYYFMYYAGDEPYTRIVEYKLLTGYQSKETLIGIEFPSDSNKLYPYPTKAEVDRAKRYFADMPKGVYSIGRLGSYKYKDMYDIYKDCKNISKEL